MKYYFLLFVLMFQLNFKSDLLAQVTEGDSVSEVYCQFYLDTALKKEVYLFADSKAQFPGGDKELLKFISLNTKFPEGIEKVNGTVFVEFVVGTNGTILRKAIRRPIDRALDEEALKILDLMPHWIPAYCDGKAVPFLIRIPIKFVKK